MAAITIAQISDCHLFAQINKVGYGQINPYDSLAAVLDAITSHQPDIVLVTGDISADGSEQSYHHFLALIQQVNLQDRMYVIAGNHDNTPWFDSLLSRYDLAKHGAVTRHNWSIHGVDTRYKGTLGRLSTEQLQRLESDIANSDSPYQLVACHHHPFSCGGWMDKHEWVNRKSFTDMIEQHQNVKGVIYGHIHSQQTAYSKHCVYASCPASCWQWSTQPEFAIDPSLPGYNLLTLCAAGELTISTHRLKQESASALD